MTKQLSTYIVEIFNGYNEIIESFTVHAHSWREARNKANGRRTKEGSMSVKKEGTMEVKQ